MRKSKKRSREAPEFAWKRASEEEMIEDEWPRNTRDEVDSIGYSKKREEMRTRKKKEERHWEREQRKGMNEKARKREREG